MATREKKVYNIYNGEERLFAVAASKSLSKIDSIAKANSFRQKIYVGQLRDNYYFACKEYDLDNYIFINLTEYRIRSFIRHYWYKGFKIYKMEV